MEGRAALKHEVEQKGKYQRFLDSVCEDSSEYFENIEDITNRYETLAAAHLDLRSRTDKAQREQEEETAQLNGFVKRSQNDLLVYNSDIANKQQELDARRYKTADGDAALYKVETEAKEGKRELGEIEMAIHNIHNRCVRVRGPNQHEGLDGAELQAQLLEAIKQRVVDLQSIVHEIRTARRLAALQMGDATPNTAGTSSAKPGAAAMGSSSGAAGASGGGGGDLAGRLVSRRRDGRREVGRCSQGTRRCRACLAEFRPERQRFGPLRWTHVHRAEGSELGVTAGRP